jgi:exodeoxyribonuclease VIII
MEVMLDLETLSTETNAAIISIGAVKFEPRALVTGKLGDPSDPEYKHFYCNVEFHSLSSEGFHFEGRTVQWWMEQTKEARDSLFVDAKNIETALGLFWTWFGPKSLPTWGNGAGFDNAILRSAYRKFHGVTPFDFYHDRCFRTMKSLFPDVPYVKPTLAHNALSDAEAQAIHLQKIFNFIPTGAQPQ